MSKITNRKMVSTLLVLVIIGMIISIVFPSTMATDFHVIKGTLYIDDSIAEPGIQINIWVPEKNFNTTIATINITTDEDNRTFNYNTGGFDHSFEGTTVYFNITYMGNIFEPWDNKSVTLDKNQNPVETYIMDMHVNTSSPGNHPPYTPSNPSPGNGATNVDINTDLTWTGGDPDPNDTITYDIYFGTTNPPPQVSNNQTTTTYNPGTMNYQTTYYWRIIAWDNHNTSTTGPTWHFTTKTPGGGGNGGNGDQNGGNETNNPPVANADGPYYGMVGEEIEFNGSLSYDPDNDIVSYKWDFGDG
ncbi:MAG: hypothetical protein DRN05_06070, partial [Thermoplasmata archaeon]